MATTPLSETAALANECDLLAVGRTHHQPGRPQAIWDVLTSIDAINCAKKPAFAFGSFGWTGEAPEMLRSRLAQLRFSVPRFRLPLHLHPRPGRSGRRGRPCQGGCRQAGLSFFSCFTRAKNAAGMCRRRLCMESVQQVLLSGRVKEMHQRLGEGKVNFSAEGDTGPVLGGAGRWRECGAQPPSRRPPRAGGPRCPSSRTHPHGR